MYKVSKVIDPELLTELHEDFKSGTMRSKAGAMSDPQAKNHARYGDARKCTVMYTPVVLWPEIAQQIEDFVGDGSKVNQFDYILYKEGDWFIKHNDTGVSFPNRKWTTVTLIDLSDDYEGDGLCLYDDKGEEVFPKMEIGDTILFDSDIYHEAKRVKKGTRLVLVAWLVKNS
jgi:predicted 2-oxoglutarate/Fe(II)-dependent dioxygenase YbiX